MVSLMGEVREIVVTGWQDCPWHDEDGFDGYCHLRDTIECPVTHEDADLTVTYVIPADCPLREMQTLVKLGAI